MRGCFAGYVQSIIVAPQKAVVGKTTWVDVSCVTMTQRSYNTCLSHLEVKKLEAQLCSSRKDGGLQQAFTFVESAKRKAMKAAMRCLYWLAKQKNTPYNQFC